MVQCEGIVSLAMPCLIVNIKILIISGFVYLHDAPVFKGSNHMCTDIFFYCLILSSITCQLAGNCVRMSSPMHNYGGSGEPAHKRRLVTHLKTKQKQKTKQMKVDISTDLLKYFQKNLRMNELDLLAEHFIYSENYLLACQSASL